MAILFFISGLIFMVLFNLLLNQSNDYTIDDYPYRYHQGHLYRDDPYYSARFRRRYFSEQLTAIINTVLFVLLLVAVIMYYNSSAY